MKHADLSVLTIMSSSYASLNLNYVHGATNKLKRNGEK
jgi:hypothetical protein